jgi:hypothetical protein
MNREQVEFLVKLRDALTMAAEAANDYLETFAPKEEKTAVSEETFTVLKFEVQQGAKIGEYEVAYQPSNIAEKWTSAINVLKNSNATIKDRYHGRGYVFAYWLYGEGKIYRQKLKGKKP